MTTKTTSTPHQEVVQKSRVSRGLLAGGLVFFILFSASIAFAFYLFQYEERVLPNVSVGGVLAQGMSRDEVKEALNARFATMIEEGLTIRHDDIVKEISLSTSLDAELSFDLVTINVDDAAEKALSYGHQGPWYQRLRESMGALVASRNFPAMHSLSENALVGAVRDQFGSEEQKGAPTDFIFDSTFTTVTIQQGVRGTEINEDAFLNALSYDLSDLALGVIDIEITDSPEPLRPDQISTQNALEILALAPLTLTYTSDTKRTYTWTLEKELLATALLPVKLPEEDGPEFTLSLTDLAPLFDAISQDINIDPVDARFQIIDGKVTEFVGSQNGIVFDLEETTQSIVEALWVGRATGSVEPLTVTANITEPDILTGEVNDLGITEVLGMGWSGWKGSPPNRIKNIRHATQKLDGLLIAPGEQTSLTSKLGPLTLADGYLPEMVIAGDEIKPEIAGGLCQIGTTVFRAAMNAGLQIDQRRNHSLVVSYYNDPSNGNPGTDATLYEPVLDLKFTNTTGNHILLTTEFDETGEQLLYTFWGTNKDGRKAYYTPPQVLSRTSPGPTRYTDTTSLAPGQMKCQHAYSGAKTTFDYIIEYPDGTRTVQNFTSQYRALPQICLRGIDPNTPPAEETSVDGTVIPEEGAPADDEPIIE